jgi:fructose-specific phosphotransferase system IIC component
MFPAIVLSEATSLGVIFLFVVALVWLGARRKERQDFYLSEMVKKISASSGESAAEFLREYERTRSRRRREAMIIGGLVGSFAAGGLMIFLHGLVSLPVYRVGLIPLLPCLGLLIYALAFAPRDK